MGSEPADLDLLELAEDELGRALGLSWRELAPLVPWGDTYEGFAESGAPVMVERSYIWADRAGGDILCEVAVFRNQVLYDQGVRLSERIRERD